MNENYLNVLRILSLEREDLQKKIYSKNSDPTYFGTDSEDEGFKSPELALMQLFQISSDVIGCSDTTQELIDEMRWLHYMSGSFFAQAPQAWKLDDEDNCGAFWDISRRYSKKILKDLNHKIINPNKEFHTLLTEYGFTVEM